MLLYPNAKINLGLNIVEKRPDGYHNIETVFYPIGLSGVFAGWYYISQRVLKVSLKESPFLMVVAKLHFWVYFITILLAVVIKYTQKCTVFFLF